MTAAGLLLINVHAGLLLRGSAASLQIARSASNEALAEKIAGMDRELLELQALKAEQGPFSPVSLPVVRHSIYRVQSVKIFEIIDGAETEIFPGSEPQPILRSWIACELRRSDPARPGLALIGADAPVLGLFMLNRVTLAQPVPSLDHDLRVEDCGASEKSRFGRPGRVLAYTGRHVFADGSSRSFRWEISTSGEDRDWRR